ncbi:hypothetical protein ACH5RR_008675, partial [Cinchona calisaya]
ALNQNWIVKFKRNLKENPMIILLNPRSNQDREVQEELEGKPNDYPTQPKVQTQAPEYAPTQAQNMDNDDDIDTTYDFIMQPRASSNPTLEDQHISDHDD